MLRGRVVIDDSRVTALLNVLQVKLSDAGMQTVLKEAGRRIEQIIDLDYPPQINAPLPKLYRWDDGKLHKFKSLRHQRGFFALLNKGVIQIPYRRTRTLARSMRVIVRVRGTTAEILVSIPDESKAGKYAKHVLGIREQSYYFKNLTRWKPLQAHLNDQLEDFIDVTLAAFESFFDLDQSLGVA